MNEGVDKLSPLDKIALRRAFGSFPTGVCVAGAVVDGHRIGLTVNSFSSVSLDPPLVLICLAHSLRSHDMFLRARGFAVSVLSQDQADISRRFATSALVDKWSGVDALPGRCDGLIVDRHLAFFDCKAEQAVTSGDHTILIGRLIDYGHNRQLTPLVYCNGKYSVVHSACLDP